MVAKVGAGAPKASHVITLAVKPLSLHHRVHALPSELAADQRAREIAAAAAAAEDDEDDGAREAKGGAKGGAKEDDFGEGLAEVVDLERSEAKSADPAASRGGATPEADGIDEWGEASDAQTGDGPAADDAAGGPGGSGGGGAAMHRLELTGAFSLRMAHDWVSACLPEVPPYVDTGHAGRSGG